MHIQIPVPRQYFMCILDPVLAAEQQFLTFVSHILSDTIDVRPLKMRLFRLK